MWATRELKAQVLQCTLLGLDVCVDPLADPGEGGKLQDKAQHTCEEELGRLKKLEGGGGGDHLVLWLPRVEFVDFCLLLQRVNGCSIATLVD